MHIVRHYFPGGNTSLGFVSFYNNILRNDTPGKLAIIKGGPGTGKSSLMKKIGEYFKSENEYVHYLHCSSDCNSLDGVYLPKYNSAVIDGTSPHVVDARYPGAYDKIFNVGALINDKITQNKEDIYCLSRNISKKFSDCYANLRVAASVYDIMQNVSLESRIEDEIHNFCYNVSKRVIHERDSGKVRKMFLSAITPQGLVNYFDSIMGDKYVIKLDCDTGDGAGEILKKLILFCTNQNTDMDIYYCPLKPYEPEHIVFKNTHIALSVSNKFHNISEADEIVYFKDFVKNDYDNSHNLTTYEQYINKALFDVKEAKILHDELESYYIRNFDFTKMDAFFEDIKAFLVS